MNGRQLESLLQLRKQARILGQVRTPNSVITKTPGSIGATEANQQVQSITPQMVVAPFVPLKPKPLYLSQKTNPAAPKTIADFFTDSALNKSGSFMRERQVKSIVENVETPATCLLVLCLDEWGTEMFEWEPDTLIQAARMLWNAKLPQANRDKIWALVTHITTDSFYSNLEAFIHICNALSGRGVDFEQFDPAEVDEMCWGITEAFLVNPMEKQDRFNEEIIIYMEQRLEYEGFQKVPHILRRFAQLPTREEELNQVLTSDEIGFENYWKSQEARLANLDIWIRERLLAVFTILEGLPLRHANEQGLQRICERAKSALGSQSNSKSEVQAASR